MKQYCFTKFQWMRYLVQGSLILILFCYVFYKSLWPVLPGIPFLYFYIQKTKQRLSQREESRMLQQFKDSITVLSGMLLSPGMQWKMPWKRRPERWKSCGERTAG